MIVQKLLVLKSATASFETRLSDYEAALFYLQNFSLIGTGYGDDSAMVTALNTKGFSNGVFAVLVSGGIFFRDNHFISINSKYDQRIIAEKNNHALILCSSNICSIDSALPRILFFGCIYRIVFGFFGYKIGRKRFVINL